MLSNYRIMTLLVSSVRFVEIVFLIATKNAFPHDFSKP